MILSAEPVFVPNDLAAGLKQYLLGSLKPELRVEHLEEVVSRAVSGLVSYLEQGHVCVPLVELFGPEASTARTLLLEAGLAAVQGLAPLVVDNNDRLYFYRYFAYERRLALALGKRTSAVPTAWSGPQVAVLRALFQENAQTLKSGEVDWQLAAAALALSNRLTVISGGPGTGKTRTVVAILVGLLAEDRRTRIMLCAPTGKAAARLQETLQARLGELPEFMQDVKLPEAQTVHRLLGLQYVSTQPRYGKDRPLPVDVLIVDEASMIDLALATKLIEALPEAAKLIMLGDKDQLAAVEAGSVFHILAEQTGYRDGQIENLLNEFGLDLSAYTTPTESASANPLAGSTVWLQRSYRFGMESTIGRLAVAVRDQTLTEDTAAGVISAADDTVEFWDCDTPAIPNALLERLTDEYASFMEAVLQQSNDVMNLLRRFEECRILCALRQGPRGTETLNAEIGRRIQRRCGLLIRCGELWYPGRPIVITGNDYGLRLFNGEVGIALPDKQGGYRVWFSDANHDVRSVAASRLPRHETAYCSTVHKSQGSEYERVCFVLPRAASGILSRELIYTAVTRARTAVHIVGSRAVLYTGIGYRTQRNSGLAEQLIGVPG